MLWCELWAGAGKKGCPMCSCRDLHPPEKLYLIFFSLTGLYSISSYTASEKGSPDLLESGDRDETLLCFPSLRLPLLPSLGHELPHHWALSTACCWMSAE